MAQKRKNIVLVPLPFQGHINPMLQLATLLYSKSFSITISQTLPNVPDPYDFPDFRFIPIKRDLSDVQDPRDFVSSAVKLNENSRDLLLEALNPQTKQEDVVCIIYDSVLFLAEEVARKFDIPSVVLHTGSANTLFSLYSLPRLKGEGYLPVQDSSKLEEIVPGFHPFRFKDLFVYSLEEVDHWTDLISSTCNTRTSSAVIINTTDCLDQSTLSKIQREYCKIPIFAVGPIHRFSQETSSCRGLSGEEKTCLSFLDKQETNSVLYVSFGSIAWMNEKELIELAWGLAKGEQPFLWVVRPGSIQDSNQEEILPQGFTEKVGDRCCIVKWAPQKDVLAHPAVGGFLSHCGWNSTLESLSEGVPMICRPCFGDQKGNRRCLTHVWRVALELKDELERSEIEKAIRRLMTEKEGEEMRQRAKTLKEEIEACVRVGGSSHRSLNELAEFVRSL